MAVANKTKDKLYQLYSTPILQKIVPNTETVNAVLKSLILEKEKEIQSVSKSNYGGWHSNADLFRWQLPEVVQLKSWVHDGLEQVLAKLTHNKAFTCNYKVSAWANVNRAGDMNKVHTHPLHHWSGVYYVSVGNSSPSDNMGGALVINDPRSGADMLPTPNLPMSQDVNIKPQPGMMIMFPSWLPHGTLPFRGEGERISIAFNIRITELSLEEPS